MFRLRQATSLPVPKSRLKKSRSRAVPRLLGAVTAADTPVGLRFECVGGAEPGAAAIAGSGADAGVRPTTKYVTNHWDTRLPSKSPTTKGRASLFFCIEVRPRLCGLARIKSTVQVSAESKCGILRNSLWILYAFIVYLRIQWA
jgi:hypothetical protein